MMSQRLEAINLTIQHMRNAGERMPVVRMHMSEGPSNAVESKTVLDPWIVIYILIIVVVNEPMPKGLPEDHPNNSR
jgi:hypothetical protein